MARTESNIAAWSARHRSSTWLLGCGIGINTIPDRARAFCDIRIPLGMTVERVRAELATAIDSLPDVSWRDLECAEPSWTDPEEEIVRVVHGNPSVVTGQDVVVNLRTRFSDARFLAARGGAERGVRCGAERDGKG